MLKKRTKSIRFFRNGDTSRKIFQFLFFWLVCRRGGVVEFTSEKSHVENEDGLKFMG
jgi:hypothetical protein